MSYGSVNEISCKGEKQWKERIGIIVKRTCVCSVLHLHLITSKYTNSRENRRKITLDFELDHRIVVTLRSATVTKTPN